MNWGRMVVRVFELKVSEIERLDLFALWEMLRRSFPSEIEHRHAFDIFYPLEKENWLSLPAPRNSTPVSYLSHSSPRPSSSASFGIPSLFHLIHPSQTASTSTVRGTVTAI